MVQVHASFQMGTSDMGVQRSICRDQVGAAFMIQKHTALIQYHDAGLTYACMWWEEAGPACMGTCTMDHLAGSSNARYMSPLLKLTDTLPVRE